MGYVFRPSAISLRNNPSTTTTAPQPSQWATDVASVAGSVTPLVVSLVKKDEPEVEAPLVLDEEEPSSPWPWIVGGVVAVAVVGGVAYAMAK